MPDDELVGVNAGSSVDTVPANSKPQEFALLNEILEAPIDFGAFKTVERHMLNCGPKYKGLHQPSEAGFLYTYCLFKGVKKSEGIPGNWAGDARILQFVVHKTSLEGKNAYYNASNEVLLSAEAHIPHEALQLLNWVGKPLGEAMNKLGPGQQVGESIAWWQNDRLLVMHFEKEQVAWIKWRWVTNLIQSPADLPANIWEWDTK